MRIAIDDSGRVTEAVASVDEAHRELGTCIEAAVKAAEFPEGVRGTTITYPFVF